MRSCRLARIIQLGWNVERIVVVFFVRVPTKGMALREGLFEFRAYVPGRDGPAPCTSPAINTSSFGG